MRGFYLICGLLWASAAGAQEVPLVEQLLARFDELYQSQGTRARVEERAGANQFLLLILQR